MGWICLPGLGDSQSPSEIGSNHSLTVNSTDTFKEYFLAEWPKVSFPLPPLPPTSMTLWRGISRLNRISYTEAFRAKTSARLDLERAWMESEAAFIGSCTGLSQKSTHDLYFLKTYQQLGLGGLVSSSNHLPSWGMIVAGRLYQPKKLEPRTSARGGSCWPTPAATRSGTSNNGNPGDGRTEYRTKGNPSLDTIARRWPTPRASDGAKGGPNSKGSRGDLTMPSASALWATPATRDHKDRKNPRRHGKHSPSIAIQASENGHRGYLSPLFIEAIMGYCAEWTVCADWAMLWFRSKREKRLKD
jgi:hypothetical protein